MIKNFGRMLIIIILSNKFFIVEPIKTDHTLSTQLHLPEQLILSLWLIGEIMRYNHSDIQIYNTFTNLYN